MIAKAHDPLIAKRKLTLILSSKATKDIPISVRDLVQVYIKLSNQKLGKWTTPKPVIHFDRMTKTITVPARNGKTINAAIEDVRIAVVEGLLANSIEEAIDKMDNILEDTFDDLITSDEEIEMILLNR